MSRTMFASPILEKILAERSRDELIELVIGYRQRWLKVLGTYTEEDDGEEIQTFIPQYMKVDERKPS